MITLLRPAAVTEEHLKFLGELNAEGINLADTAGAAPYLVRHFGLKLEDAHTVVDYFWAKRMAATALTAKAKRRPRSDRGIRRGRRGPNEGSLFHWMSSFSVGEVRYREFALDDPSGHSALRSLCSATRYPDSMNGWRFTGERLIAIPALTPFAPRMILKVERVK